MASVTAQPPAASMSSRSSPAVNGNGNANLDYINGHGALPDSPASAVPPPATHSKKSKAANTQKPQDDQKKTEKLLAARINELEQNTKGDKEQEAEIGMSISTQSTYTRQVRYASRLPPGLACRSRFILPTYYVYSIALLFGMQSSCIASVLYHLLCPRTLRLGIAYFSTCLDTYFLVTKANTYECFVVSIEREVKKATRDLTNLLTGMETPLSRLEAVQAQYKDLLGRMKRLDKENAKNKKRGDNFQKEKEAQRSELSKTVSLKEKLEKLCRELTKENKKVKVRHAASHSDPVHASLCPSGNFIADLLTGPLPI